MAANAFVTAVQKTKCTSGTTVGALGPLAGWTVTIPVNTSK